jgi:integrase
MATITKLPDGRYLVRWRTPEGDSRHKIENRRVDADQLATNVEASKLDASYIDTARTTLAEWWTRYQRETVKRATTTARDRTVMETWWLPALGRMSLGKMTPNPIRGVVEQMREKLAPATVRTNYGVLRAVLSAAVDAEVIARSPCRGIRLGSTHRTEPRHISAEELHRLADATPIEYRAMVYIGGVLGLRSSEVAGLRVGRIRLPAADFDGRGDADRG